MQVEVPAASLRAVEDHEKAMTEHLSTIILVRFRETKVNVNY